jgi:hypothetical protein
MSNLLDVVKKNCKTILLMEAVGLLHDVGKLGDEFIKSQSQEYFEGKNKYEYDFGAIVDPISFFNILSNINWLNSRSKWDAPYKTISPNCSEILLKTDLNWNGKSYSVAEILLTQVHHYNRDKKKLEQEWYKAKNKSSKLSELTRKIHGISHYEKDADNTGRQPYQETYFSTPFGFERRICVDSPYGLTEALRKLPLERITEILTCDRLNWYSLMRLFLAQGIADTRRSDNEVNLWDWGYTVASFIKSAIPSILIHGESVNLDDLSWRIFSFNLNILDYYTRVNTITDLLGIQSTIDEAFSKVKHLLEEAWPMANEIYRDETGIYFIFPDLDIESSFEKMLYSCFPSDLIPFIKQNKDDKIEAKNLSTKNHKILIAEVKKLIADPRTKALKELSHAVRPNNFYDWQKEWKLQKSKGGVEVCTVCGMRPIGDTKPGLAPWATPKKAKERHICCVCLDRRGRRSKNWAEKVIDRGSGTLGEDFGTIWTNEVSDINGRLALIVGKFELEKWLDGTFVQTLLASADFNNSQIKPKNPSPARLRRIWETTRRFWQEILPTDDQEKIANSELGRFIRSSTPRLKIQGVLSCKEKAGEVFGDYHVYEMAIESTKLSVVWIPGPKEKPNDGYFITADNLEYISKQLSKEQDVAGWLAGKTITIEEPSGYGSEIKTWGTISINNDGISSLSNYIPAIPILAEPKTFMALVPAKSAQEAAKSIAKKYQEEMNKVHNRLSLHIGIIYAERRTPIRAVLEAGMKMLNINTEMESWKVSKIEKDSSKPAFEKDNKGNATTDTTGAKIELPSFVKITLSNKNKEATWRVQTVMGDKNSQEPTFDHWYPYVFLNIKGDGSELDNRHRKFNIEWQENEAIKDLWLVHAAELKEGDNIDFAISTFDFEFLDVAGRRFEIYYDKDGKRPGRLCRPYLLDELKTIEEIWKLISCETKGLTNTQITSLLEIIEKRRKEWKQESDDDRTTFENFVKQALQEAWGKSWKNLSQEQQQQLDNSAISGMLADVVELYMKIMKENSNKKSA